MSFLYIFKCPHGKTLNFLHQCELCAKDHFAERAETIRTQQATIDRLTEQRDRLLKVSTEYRRINQCGSPSCQINVVFSCKCTNCVSDRLDALIAEIEAKNGDI